MLFCLCACVCVYVCVCVHGCKWYHLVFQKQYELRCILNAPIEGHVTDEREPNAGLNNAYWRTIRYLNTILPLKNFSVFSYLSSVLLHFMNHLQNTE